MSKFSFQLDVRDPPAKVIGAMVDFSERRPEIWPNLTPRLYRVHALGPGTADVTEGTALPGMDIWERVTYEWTDSVVRSVLVDGRIFRPGGTVEFRVVPHGDGSRIFNDYDRRSHTLLGRCLGAMFQLSGGATHQANLSTGLRRAALTNSASFRSQPIRCSGCPTLDAATRPRAREPASPRARERNYRPRRPDCGVVMPGQGAEPNTPTLGFSIVPPNAWAVPATTKPPASAAKISRCHLAAVSLARWPTGLPSTRTATALRS